LIARAILQAQSGEKVCPQEFQNHFLDEILAEDLDPKAMHLRPGSSFDYSNAQILKTAFQEVVL
jgi:hypothetical protein